MTLSSNSFPSSSDLDLLELSLESNSNASTLDQALLVPNLFDDLPSSNLIDIGFGHWSNDPFTKSSSNPNCSLDPSSIWWPTSPMNTTTTSIPSVTTLLDQHPTQPIFEPISLQAHHHHPNLIIGSLLTQPLSSLPPPSHDRLDPILSIHDHPTTDLPPSNSIEYWIDFTGGDRSSSVTSSFDESPPPSNLASIINSNNHPKPHELETAEGVPFEIDQKPSKRRISSSSSSSSSSFSFSSSSSSTCTPPSGPCSPSESKPKKKITKEKRELNRSSRTKRHDFLERNRLAASRSREKKRSYQRQLEEESNRLESEQIRLKKIIQDLIQEKETLKKLLLDRDYQLD